MHDKCNLYQYAVFESVMHLSHVCSLVLSVFILYTESPQRNDSQIVGEVGTMTMTQFLWGCVPWDGCLAQEGFWPLTNRDMQLKNPLWCSQIIASDFIKLSSRSTFSTGEKFSDRTCRPKSIPISLKSAAPEPIMFLTKHKWCGKTTLRPCAYIPS